ncbi:hypothetical protein T492DRAFT_1090424 [Pavlovales sp. CCMP2436]|nr:hypothetical protein T492DRAFT_1090424 [Pavlovales sp. CCMP2436]
MTRAVLFVLLALRAVALEPGPAVLRYAALPPLQTCPAGNLPIVRGLRIATHAARERAVSFLAWTRSEAAADAAPLPIMSSAAALGAACARYLPHNRKQWGFCTGAEAYFHDRYACGSASYVAAVGCAFLDPDVVEHTRPGLVYTREATYATHLSSGKWGQVITQPTSRLLRTFAELAHALGVYPTSPAHALERFPRVLELLLKLPAHVPLLLAREPLVGQFISVLDAMARAGCDLRGGGCSGAQRARSASGVLQPLAEVLAALPRAPAPGNFSRRVVWWESMYTYHAQRLYFAAESVLVEARMPAENTNMPDPTPGWYDLLDEAPCHYKRIQPSWLVQRALVPAFTRPAQPAGLSVLLVHRAETSVRQLRNHPQLERALRAALPFSRVQTFIGSEHTLASTISLFANADLVVAGHGAACAFWTFMRPGAVVVEIAYPSTSVMGFPASYYFPFAVSLRLRYHLSFALEGSYTSPMHADVDDVVLLAVRAAQWLGDERRHMRKKRQGAGRANDTALTTLGRKGHLAASGVAPELAAGGRLRAREMEDTETSPLTEPASAWRPGMPILLVAALGTAALMAVSCLMCYDSHEKGGPDRW